jgi:hypothetical protein
MDVAGTSGLVAALVLMAAPMLWVWWRSPRQGKDLAPMLGGRWEPVQFRPGPAPLPEHDAATIAARQAADRSPDAGVRRLGPLEQLVGPREEEEAPPEQGPARPASAVA